MLIAAKLRTSLQRRELALGILAASGIALVIAAMLIIWGLGRGGDSSTRSISSVLEVSVPREISLSEHFAAFTDGGTPLEMTGNEINLAFREGYLAAMDFPISYLSDHSVATFSDTSASLSLLLNRTGQRVITFHLLSENDGIPLKVTGTVKSIEPIEDSSMTRLILQDLRAETDVSTLLPPANGPKSIDAVQLEFELRRLPEDARLTISHIDELDEHLLASIESALAPAEWTTSLAFEARKTNLENVDDIGEAAVIVTLSHMDQTLPRQVAVVHLDDGGNANLLGAKILSRTENNTVIRFASQSGLSTFAVLISSSGSDSAIDPTATIAATNTPTSFPRSTATMTPAPTLEAPPTASPIPTPTTSPTPAATPSSTPTPTRPPLPSPTSGVGPSPTAGATLVPSAVPTPTSTPGPTPTQTPPPTSTSPPTSNPPPTSTRTSTPNPTPDEHYAAIVHTHDPTAQEWFLDVLNTKWFLDWKSNVDSIPSGHEKIIPILDLPGPSSEVIQDIADQAPGSVWYIVGEPNRRAGYGASDVVVQLHDLYMKIKDADSTARITSPSILNWDFTCNGCGGYTQGSTWLDEFRASYLSQYGVEPPIDVWAIDVYPIDWDNLPTVNHQIAIDQVNDMREYLNSVGQSNTPIWITELGLHWGYDAMLYSGDEGYDESCDPLPMPAGTYHTDQVIGYLDAVFDWLDANAISKKVEKWFLYNTYTDITTCNSGTYAGLTLFDGPDIGASLTEVGEFFRDRVLGISQ